MLAAQDADRFFQRRALRAYIRERMDDKSTAEVKLKRKSEREGEGGGGRGRKEREWQRER